MGKAHGPGSYMVEGKTDRECGIALCGTEAQNVPRRPVTALPISLTPPTIIFQSQSNELTS